MIIKQVSVWSSLIIKLFHHFSPNLYNSADDSPDQTVYRIKIQYNLRSSHPTPPWLPSDNWQTNREVFVVDAAKNAEAKVVVEHRNTHLCNCRTQSVLKRRPPHPTRLTGALIKNYQRQPSSRENSRCPVNRNVILRHGLEYICTGKRWLNTVDSRTDCWH